MERIQDIENVRMVPIDEVLPYVHNTKIHNVTQVRKIATSIATYGWDQPIVVDEENIIIKGHGRLKAAQLLGLKNVPVVAHAGLSDDEIRAARIIDNKSAESEWDVNALWKEVKLVSDAGINFSKMGFDPRQIRRLFPDTSEALGVSGTPGNHDDENGSRGVNPDGTIDATDSERESFIGLFKGSDTWLRKLSMVDYLNYHDKIVVGFSSGKDSMAALIWILENCDKDKLFVYYTNPGWGIDWPHSLAFIPIMEKLYGIRIYMSGPGDPAAPGAWEDNLLQMGFPGMRVGCWVESHVKIPRANALLKQEGLIGRDSGLRVVQIIAIRWAESPRRAKSYPDRGILKDNGNHYGNPVLQWSNADVGKFLADRNIYLHTAYQGEDRMGCLLCPKGTPTGAVTIRKKFPKHWKKVCDWYALGTRRGSSLNEMFKKWVIGIGDSKIDDRRFAGEFSHIAVSTADLEDRIEEVVGEPLPIRPYLTEEYDPAVHKMKDDLKVSWLGQPETSESTGGCQV